MDKVLKIRNVCIEEIRKEFRGAISVAELDGNYFAGADIALKENDCTSVYRVAVIKHKARLTP